MIALAALRAIRGVLEAAVRYASIYDPARFLAEGMVSTWTQRSFCHSSNPIGTGIRTHASSHHYGVGVVFTSYALDLKHIEGAVQVTASIKRHWQRAPSAIAGGSTRDPLFWGKRISLSPMPVYFEAQR